MFTVSVSACMHLQFVQCHLATGHVELSTLWSIACKTNWYVQLLRL